MVKSIEMKYGFKVPTTSESILGLTVEEFKEYFYSAINTLETEEVGLEHLLTVVNSVIKVFNAYVLTHPTAKPELVDYILGEVSSLKVLIMVEPKKALSLVSGEGEYKKLWVDFDNRGKCFWG